MKKLIVVFVCSLAISSCKEKECRYVNLPSIKCESGFDLVKNTDYSQIYFSNDTSIDQLIIINDDSTYLATFSSYSTPPFGTVDFTTTTLLGVNTTTNPSLELKSQGYLCKSESADKWKFTVQYSLEGQCEESGIESITINAWLICPKIPDNADIELNIEDVNPI